MNIKFILSLFTALLLGILLTIAVAPMHPFVLQRASAIFKNSFEQALDCSVSCQVRTVHLLRASIEVEQMVVSPRAENDHGWSWECKKYSMGFSWYNLLRHGILTLWVDIDGLHATTEIKDNQAAIEKHLHNLQNGPRFPLPSVLHQITISGDVKAYDTQKNGIYFLKWKSESKQLKEMLKSRVYIKDAKISLAQQTYCAASTGDITVEIAPGENGPAIAIKGEGRVNIPQLTKDPWCFINIDFNHNNAHISAYNASKTFLLDPLQLTHRTDGWWFIMKAALPLSYLDELGIWKKKELDGNTQIHADIAGTLDTDWVHGEITIPQLQITSDLPHIYAHSLFEKKGPIVSGDFAATASSIIAIEGTWDAHLDKNTGSFSAQSTNDLCSGRFKPWHIQPGDMYIKGKFTDNSLHATYQGTCTKSTSLEQVETHGTISFTNKIITIQGLLDNKHSYDLQCGIEYPYLHHLFFLRDGKTVALSLQSYLDEQIHKFDGLCTIPFARAVVRELFHYDLQAEGNIFLHGELLGYGAKAWVQLSEGTIRLPQTYNFINGFEGYLFLDFLAHKIMVKDLYCTLHEGVARINQASMYFDDQWYITYAHTPLLLDRCVLQLKKDLFGMLSGSLIAEYNKNNIPFVSGSLLLDRAQLKENIFADEFQKQLFGTLESSSAHAPIVPNIACNITVETKEPVRVDTPFLKTNARLALTLQNTFADPHVQGGIKLLGGELKFPHKPMHITRGSIQFVPDQLTNPLVELVAKNTIKKNNISLYVTGTVLNHQIILESTPPLSQEQIISLLMVGSHDDTLNSMMPAFIAHNIKNLIFGGHQSGFLDKYFKPIMQPLSINLVPSFSDQTGRGGLRAAIEITVNDRWRALIQKNFSLTEDTRLELEYIFSDDVSIRAIRDERRDMGAEIEVRFKF